MEKPLKLEAKPDFGRGCSRARNQEMWRLRFEEGMTLAAIGRRFGISPQAVVNALVKEPKRQRKEEQLARILDGRPRSVLWTTTYRWTPEKQEEEIRRERKEILSKLEELPKSKMYLK